ncbi:contractile injection system tape measure protein, partial [Candidatus Cardinium hertigii]
MDILKNFSTIKNDVFLDIIGYHIKIIITPIAMRMPIHNHHVILRSRIEVTTEKSHDQNRALQYAVNRTVEQQLIPLLSKLFSQYVPQDVVIHIDKLTVDGGKLNVSNLSSQLPYQIASALLPVLQKQIDKIMHNPNVHQVIPLLEAKLQAIAYYLSEGNFAWWMTEHSDNQIEKIYIWLLHNAPLRIEQLWHNIKKKEKAIQRCIAHFSGTTVENTLHLLLRQQNFTPILSEIGFLLHKTGILTNSPYTPQRQLLSIALLGMINHQRPTIDRISFLTMLLKQVAAKTSISYKKILEKLQTYYTQTATQYASSSQAITTKEWVLQLHDMTITPPKFCNKDVKNQETVLKELDKIDNSTMTPHQLLETINRIKAAMDTIGIRILIKSWLREKKNRERLVKKLPDTLFISLIQPLDSSVASIFSTLTQIWGETTSASTVALNDSVKEATLAYYAFEPSKIIYFKQITSLFNQYFSEGTPAVNAIMAQLVSVQKIAPTAASVFTQTKTLQNDMPNFLIDKSIVIAENQQIWNTCIPYLHPDKADRSDLTQIEKSHTNILEQTVAISKKNHTADQYHLEREHTEKNHTADQYELERENIAKNYTADQYHLERENIAKNYTADQYYLERENIAKKHTADQYELERENIAKKHTADQYHLERENIAKKHTAD